MIILTKSTAPACRSWYRIEKHVNELDGVICKVKLNKKIAVVSLYKDVDESLIKDTIEKLDFTVVGME